MALTNNINHSNGLSAPRSYIKVLSVEVTKQNGTAVVAFYAEQNKEAFQNKSYAFAYDLDEKNPIAQAYNHLKTLPEFSGAIDC
jgi:hypothetical protein